MNIEYLEQSLSPLECGQRDINSLLQTSSKGLVNIPGKVSSCQHHHHLARILLHIKINYEYYDDLMYFITARLDIPSICTRSSLFTRLLASCSLSLPLLEQRLSISSMKMVLGA